MKAAMNYWRAICNTPWRHATPLRSSSLSVALTSAVLSYLFSFLSSILRLRSSFVSSLLSKLHFLARQRSLLAITVALVLTANIASTLGTYPHTLSYFNEFVGGPLNGPAHLLDANVDWGQDLLFLRAWHHRCRKARPLHLLISETVDPRLAQIDFLPLRNHPLHFSRGELARDYCAARRLSWYVMCVNEVFQQNSVRGKSGRYSQLNSYLPNDRIGYSMIVYSFPAADR
jgi:hypothetical protein